MTPRILKKANATSASVLLVALAFNCMIWFGSRGPVARFLAGRTAEDTRETVSAIPGDGPVSVSGKAAQGATSPKDSAANAGSLRKTVGSGISSAPDDGVLEPGHAAPRGGDDPFRLAGRVEKMAAIFKVALEAFDWAGNPESRKWRGGPDFVVTLQGPEACVMDLVSTLESETPGLCLTAVKVAETPEGDPGAGASSSDGARISAAFEMSGSLPGAGGGR